MQLTNDLKSDYQRRFDSCAIRPNRMADVDALVAQIAANRKRYAAAGNPVGTPWYVVGVIHALESSLNFGRHLHNGDPLTARTVQVPAGRPKTGQPPFTWRQAPATRSDSRASTSGRTGRSRGRCSSSRVTTASATATITRRAVAVSLELLEPLQPREVRGGRHVLADGGLGAVWGRGAAATDGGEEADRLRRRAEGKGADPALRAEGDQRRRASNCSTS